MKTMFAVEISQHRRKKNLTKSQKKKKNTTKKTKLMAKLMVWTARCVHKRGDVPKIDVVLKMDTD